MGVRVLAIDSAGQRATPHPVRLPTGEGTIEPMADRLASPLRSSPVTAGSPEGSRHWPSKILRVGQSEGLLRALLIKSNFAIFFLLTVIVCLPIPASANWLTSLGEIASTAGRTGGKLAGEVSIGLESAAKIISKLPAELQKGAIAAEALPDGAWRLRNAAGETITATTPEGIRGALTGLEPGLKETGSFSFYVNEDAAFQNVTALEALPSDAQIHVAIDDASYPLLRQGKGDAAKLFAELDGNLIISIADRTLFDEAIWQLKRPLGKAGIRVLSLDGGGARALPAAGRRSAEGLPLAETIDVGALDTAFASIRGQTVIVSGKIEAGAVGFTGVSGKTGSIPLADLTRAAEAQDVNLLMLDAGTPKQPGGTTWLWQERGIANLNTAMAHTTLGHFISALSRGQGRITITTDWGEGGHFRLTAVPAASDAPAASAAAPQAGLGERAAEFAAHVAEKLAGNVAPQSTVISLNSRNTQWDLDHRLIPGVPAWILYAYAAGWVSGLIAFTETRRWWRFLTRGWLSTAPSWPRRTIMTAVYWLIFTPLVGWPALMSFFVRSIIEQIVAFFRLLAWPFRRKQHSA